MMTPIMKQKIDAVLDRVKEPETGLSIAQLGLAVFNNKDYLDRGSGHSFKIKKGGLGAAQCEFFVQKSRGF